MDTISGALFPEDEPSRLPAVFIGPSDSISAGSRRNLLNRKKELAALKSATVAETRGMPKSDRREHLYREIQRYQEELDSLEGFLSANFIPQHSPSQLLSPRAFFVSPLFSVRPNSRKREDLVKFNLPSATGSPSLSYVGPELRQSDGLVFLALLHMMRDVQVGTAVNLKPDEVCRALYGGYDGHNRERLREHIRRLQRGLVQSEKFSVQLCMGFDHPSTGPWTVGLDPKIVKLFQVSPQVWLQMQPLLSLPSGLATWLFTFIESQTKLIPMKIAHISDLCGSTAEPRSFKNTLRIALRQLADTGVVAQGWSLKNDTVTWMKASVA